MKASVVVQRFMRSFGDSGHTLSVTLSQTVEGQDSEENSDHIVHFSHFLESSRK